MKKENKKKLVYGIIGILTMGILIASYFTFFYSPYKFHGKEPIKILYVDSYHEGYGWSEGQLKGFKNTFEKEGIEIEIKRVEINSETEKDKQILEQNGILAKEVLEEFDPDLIYATDDPAQKYVLADYINTKIPIVFSGVNEEVEVYGYEKAKNVAGVLERVHFIEAVDLLNKISPGIEKVGVFGNDYFLWDLFMAQMKNDLDKFSGIEFVGWDKFHYYEDLQDKILEYQDTVDAIVFLGVDNIVDKDEKEVPRLSFVKWMVENNKLPEATFWNFYPSEGILLSVDVSAKEQGNSAGKIAYEILVEGKNPTSFEFKSTTVGEQYINLARARQLDLKIPSVILINSEVYREFPWETEK